MDTANGTADIADPFEWKHGNVHHILARSPAHNTCHLRIWFYPPTNRTCRCCRVCISSWWERKDIVNCCIEPNGNFSGKWSSTKLTTWAPGYFEGTYGTLKHTVWCSTEHSAILDQRLGYCDGNEAQKTPSPGASIVTHVSSAIVTTDVYAFAHPPRSDYSTVSISRAKKRWPNTNSQKQHGWKGG